MDRSLYENIVYSIRNGELPGDFSLSDEESGDGPRFADGAMDGITVYHMGPDSLDEAGARQMITALQHAAAGNESEADKAFAELGRTHRAISIIDELQKYIYTHTDKLDGNNVFRSVMYMILHSRSRESVKFGLSILEMFTAADEQTKEIVRRIGLSDEFTVFSVWNMLKWDNANEEIFRLIQKVHGWGRIHALERLEADTPEIRRWMIMEGIQNDVMPAYSALTVWDKADPGSLLAGSMTKEEFTAVGNIIYALLDEGPVTGISELENAQDILMSYLARSEEFDLDIEDYETVFEIWGWASGKEMTFSAVVDRCMEILSSVSCEECVRSAVMTGKGYRIADMLGIDHPEENEE